MLFRRSFVEIGHEAVLYVYPGLKQADHPALFSHEN
jgi:hypothetical protein